MPRLASQFVALPPERRALAFAQTAARMSASSVMVEKDFWVCWLLGLLFADPELAPHLVFKGGTRRDSALAQMQAQCGERTRSFLMPRLEQAIVEHLGKRNSGPSWLRYEDDPIARSPVVHFEYPTAEAIGLEYLRREVKLELGSLTDQRPTGQHTVRAWVVDDFPAAFADWQCLVTALELPRTFWEKATILHAEHYRPADQFTPGRYARHYADMGRLLLHAGAESMLSDHALCARVVDWKSRVFGRQWARYDLAKPGTFRLLPADGRLAALARDYAQMRAMFLAAPPDFDAVLAQLGAAERTLNRSATL